MEFEAYLKSKKIDPKKFEIGDQDRYVEFKNLFEQVHPNSFTQQKLFLINNIRRKYHWEEEQKNEPNSAPKKVKPKITPKPKLK